MQISKEFYRTLRSIFNLPASISIISGKWKTGKTDFGLYLLEIMLKVGMFRKVATNVHADRIPCIEDMFTLKKWFFSRTHEKGAYPYSRAFLYDEAIESTPSRKAMSKLNTEWLRFIPQISKGRGHLIVIAQESEYMESSFIHPTFVRAWFHKLALPEKHPQYRKMVRVYIPNEQETKLFLDLPKTSFQFDPYLRATFTVEPDWSTLTLEDDVKLALDYGDGMSSNELVKKYEWLHSRKEVIRRVKLGIRILKNSYLVQRIDVGKGRTKSSNE